MTYFLYILYSKKIDKFYIGITHNPEQRLISHNKYPKGWTKRGIPWEMVFTKEFSDKTITKKWESWIKKQKNKKIIQEIIHGKFDWQMIWFCGMAVIPHRRDGGSNPFSGVLIGSRNWLIQKGFKALFYLPCS